MDADESLMAKAIRSARAGVRKKEGGPFGACIVDKKGNVVAVAHNTVWKSCDATAHAEVNAIRKACKKLNTINLSGCTIYSTAEPCPMCFAAIHWARIGRIVYGANIDDAAMYGFHELRLCNAKIKDMCNLPVKITYDFMRAECVALFEEWKKLRGRPY